MIKRFLIFIAGALILGLGLVINTKTGLGTAAIMSVPHTVSLLTPFTLGTCTSVSYIIFMIIQMILDRKISIQTLGQLPFSWIFGYLLDFYAAILPIDHPSLIPAVLLAFVAVTLTALGVSIMVSMDIVVNPADGLVKSIAAFTKKPFGTIKTIVDFSMMMVSLLLGIFFLHGIGVLGIGTVIAVLLTGTIISFFNRTIIPPLKKYVYAEN